jgi:hypothetical protein
MSVGRAPLALLAGLLLGPPASADATPGLAFLEYLAGHGIDTVRDVAVDADGNLVATGGTASPDFPTTAGAYDTTFNGWHDVWIAKLDPAGNLLWSTFLGGPEYDRAYAIEIDSHGDVVVAGRAGSGFPTTAGVVQPAFGGDLHPNSLYGKQDGFVAKLSGDGHRLLFATYLGGPDDGILRDLALDAADEIYVGGGAREPHPLVPADALQPKLAGGSDGFLAKLSPDGRTLRYATYVGGEGDEVGQPSVRVDRSGRLHALFVTRSSHAPTTPGALRARPAGGDEFYLVRLSPDGRRLEVATYLGGSRNEAFETHNLALAPDGDFLVAATTSSPDFPVSPGAAQPRFGGGVTPYGGDGVIARVSADGTRLVAATYLGGTGDESLEGVALTAEGDVVATGATASPEAWCCGAGGAGRGHDALLVQLDGALSKLRFALRIGGARDDSARASALDGHGSVYFGGMSESLDLPVLGARPGRALGELDAFVGRARLAPPAAPASPAR